MMSESNADFISNKKILVIDDEPLLREMMTEVLQELGALVTEAASGPGAVEEIEKNGPFDVILSDMRMPTGGADYILNRLTQNTRSKVFLIMTGFSDLEVEQLIKIGADEVLAKPVDIEHLLSRVRYLLIQKS